MVILDPRNLKWEPKIEYRLLDNEIGYIKIPSFHEKIFKQFNDALDSFSETKGIILDLRGNRGGPWGIFARRFFNETTYCGKIVFLKPGLYRAQIGIDLKNTRESVQSLFIAPGERFTKGKL